METEELINLTVNRGDSLIFTVEIESSSDIDFDDVKFSCKNNIGDAEYVFQKSLNNGIEKEENGYRIRISPEDTELELGNYFYDIQVKTDDDVYTILKGDFKVTWDITRG